MSLTIVHSMATKYEMKNALKEGTNTSTTSTWSSFQLLLSSNFTTEQLRLAGVQLLMAPGEELH